MKIIKEFWEFSKNLHNHNGYVKRSHEMLVDVIDKFVPEEGKWFEDKNKNAIFIKKVEDGKYYGHNRDGQDIEGDVQDIRSELTNELYIGNNFVVSKKLDNKKLQYVGGGSEVIGIFTDGEYAYKIIRPDLVPEIDIIKSKYVNLGCPSVIKIHDAWLEETRDGWENVIIKMEELEPLPLEKVKDQDELEWVRKRLWESQDNQEPIKDLIHEVKDPETKKMIQAIIDAQKCLGHLDIGLHNLMYDPKNDQYKQIDIF